MEKAELQQLAARASQGESAAWEALYGEIGKISASVCRKDKLSPEDAEDVTQEASLALSGRLRELAAMDNPEGYIRRVINSKSIDLIRAASKTPMESMHEDEDYVLSLPDAADTPENKVAGTSADRLIKDFIDELPDDQREALIMRYYDGYTNAQIAEKINVPPGTVASRVRYGKQALEKLITKFEKDNKIRLHAKIAIPFLPWRMFQNQSLQTAEIIATDGGSSVSGGTRALTGFLATVVFGGAVIGTGIVMKNNNNPTDEIVPTQAVTEQVEQIDPTAAAVYKDVYETQTATVYQNVNVNSAQSTRQASRQNITAPAEQNDSEQTKKTGSGVPSVFTFAGNRFEPIENLLTSNTYHSDALGATLTFPDSWVNNVTVNDYDGIITINDRGIADNPSSEYTCLLGIDFSEESYESHRDYFYPPVQGNNGSYIYYNFDFGYSEFPDEEVRRVYTCSLSWNKKVMNKTDLDYSNINRDILSVLESFRPDNSNFTSLLTQQKKDAVMQITDFNIQAP